MENPNDDFKLYCDKFLDYVIKYSYKENIQIAKEKKAYLNGIISKNSFEKLKNARQQTILSYNNLAYNFKKISEKLDDGNHILDEKIKNLIKIMIKSCENAIVNV